MFIVMLIAISIVILIVEMIDISIVILIVEMIDAPRCHMTYSTGCQRPARLFGIPGV